VANKPDAYLYGLSQIFGCTPQAVFYMLEKLKITLKKDLYLSEKSGERRSEYNKRLKRIPENRYVYAGESGVNACLRREFARAPRGGKPKTPSRMMLPLSRNLRFSRTNFLTLLFQTVLPLLHMALLTTKIWTALP
jgi:hypothetical protein